MKVYKALKRSCTLLISIIFILSMLAGCGSGNSDNTQGSTVSSSAGASTAESTENKLLNETGLPIVNQPVKYTVLARRDPSLEEGFANVADLKRWQQETGIEIVWETYLQEAWENQKKLVVASNDLPDAFGGEGNLTDVEAAEWGAQGILIPLKELTGKYAPRFTEIMNQHPEYYKSFVDTNGEFYGFPTHFDIDFGNRGSLYYASKTLLSAVRPDTTYKQQKYFETVDHNYTTDEFYQLLKDIKAKFPDSIPLTAEKGDTNLIYWAFNSMENSNYVIVKDGKVKLTLGTPEWVEATKYLSRLYKEKLLDQEIFSHSWDAFRAKLMKPDKVGVSLMWSGLIAVSDFANMEDARYKDFVGMAPLTGPGGTQSFYRSASGVAIKNTFCITKVAKNPEILVRFQDYLYGEDESYQNSYGDYGYGLKKKDDGTIDQVFAPEGNHTLNSMFITTKEMNSKINYAPATAMAIEGGAVLAKPYQVNVAFPKMLFNTDDNKRIAELKTDITAYVDLMRTEFIVKGNIDQKIEEFKSQLEKIGINEYLQIYQKNYDTYKNMK